MTAPAVLSTAAAAEQYFGIKVSPLATTDASTEWYCRRFALKSAKMVKGLVNALIRNGAYRFRRADDDVTVSAFYQKNDGFDVLGKSGTRSRTRLHCSSWSA